MDGRGALRSAPNRDDTALCRSAFWATLIAPTSTFREVVGYGVEVGEGIVSHCEREPAKINAAIRSVMIGGTCQRSGRR